MSIQKAAQWLCLLFLSACFMAYFSPAAEGPVERIALAVGYLALAFGTLGSIFIYLRAREGDQVQQLVGAEETDVAAPIKQNGADVSGGSREELVTLAYTDQLTGLGNQRRMIEKFNSLRNDRRNGIKGFLVGFADMDGMKPINDLYGFEGGDEILKQCAQRLSAAVEQDGFVFRSRGDEFGFLFPDIKDEAGAYQIGRILQEVLLAPFDLDGRTVRLSGSFGFALYPDSGNDFEDVLRNIESALYHSKRGGRGRITVFSGEIEEMILENARMEQALRRAIANNEVQPHFQPIISLQTGKLLGFEALARWIDPELGFVSPGKFVPLAEERGIIAQLTDKLLLHAARVASGWPDDIFLSFNLSSVQLVDPTTAQSIIHTINKAGLPPQRLEIEVTETAMMTDPETASMIIDELHQAGIRISMDDFGTGQSSLGRLRELKLDKVKIDRAFIMAIGEDKPAEHIVRAILEMCAGLDLTVVAEGIEEMNQAESLKRYGCHAGQGYLFGKPQDEHKTMGYIREFMGSEPQEPVAEKISA
ncbi:MAG: EAL domain-containing protein [Rhizobiaceae bacterium]|nr:EAL domain-containing protein [Rhizobiaceae bacterium]